MATTRVTGIETHEDGEGNRIYVISFPVFSQISGRQTDVGHAKVKVDVEQEKLTKLEEEVADRKAFLAALAGLEVGYTAKPEIDVPEGILGGR